MLPASLEPHWTSLYGRPLGSPLVLPRRRPRRASYQDADVWPVVVDDGDQVEQGFIRDAVRCGIWSTGHQDHVLLKV